MKALKISLIIILVLGLIVAAGLFALEHYLRSPAFNELALGAARRALGSKVTLQQMQVSLFRGITLRGLTVANPPGYSGNLLQAESFGMRFRWWPLLHRRVEIQRLALDRPVINLVRNAQGEWNYELFAGKPSPSTGAAAGRPATTTGSSRVQLALSEIRLRRGQLVMAGDAGEILLRIDNFGLSSSIQLNGQQLSGQGHATLETLAVGHALYLRQLAAAAQFAPDAVTLAPLTGKLGGGDVHGELQMRLIPATKYSVGLQVTNSDLRTLLNEAGAQPVMTGHLQAVAQLAGTAGLSTLVGAGHADIIGGQLAEIPLLNMLATLLQVPELRSPKFDECHLEFSVTNNVMFTPVIRLRSSQVQLSGHGQVSLADFSLDHDLTLALAPTALDHVPKEIRSSFARRDDGWWIIDFRVSGPYSSPKTDLQQRLLRGAAEQFFGKGLNQFLK